MDSDKYPKEKIRGMQGELAQPLRAIFERVSPAESTLHEWESHRVEFTVGEDAKKARRLWMLLSSLALFLFFSGEVPTKIQQLGMSLPTDGRLFIWAVFSTLLYFGVAFIKHCRTDARSFVAEGKRRWQEVYNLHSFAQGQLAVSFGTHMQTELSVYEVSEFIEAFANKAERLPVGADVTASNLRRLLTPISPFSEKELWVLVARQWFWVILPLILGFTAVAATGAWGATWEPTAYVSPDVPPCTIGRP